MNKSNIINNKSLSTKMSSAQKAIGGINALESFKNGKTGADRIQSLASIAGLFI